jgi:two-component system, NarL family, invasion response regulator UvrY
MNLAMGAHFFRDYVRPKHRLRVAPRRSDTIGWHRRHPLTPRRSIPTGSAVPVACAGRDDRRTLNIPRDLPTTQSSDPGQSTMPALRVLIADDHQVVRSGLKQVLAGQPDMQVVAECSTGREALELVRPLPCDVLLLDLSLPDMSGLDVLKQIKAHHEDIHVLVVSGYPESQFGLNALRAGASGFISKGVDEPELVRAVRTVARGHRYVGPELADQLVSGVQGDPNAPRHGVLSEREFQIFCKLAAGASVSVIAATLCLSVKTVSTYRSRLLEKMAMKSNADITRYCIANGLLQ